MVQTILKFKCFPLGLDFWNGGGGNDLNNVNHIQWSLKCLLCTERLRVHSFHCSSQVLVQEGLHQWGYLGGSGDPHQPDRRSMEAYQGPLSQDIWNQSFPIWGPSMWNTMEGRGQVQYLWEVFKVPQRHLQSKWSLEYSYPTPIFPTGSIRSGLNSTSQFKEWKIKPGKPFCFTFIIIKLSFSNYSLILLSKSIQMPRQIHQKLKGPLLYFLQLRQTLSVLHQTGSF